MIVQSKKPTYDGSHGYSGICQCRAGSVEGTCEQAAVMLQHLKDDADGCARVHGCLYHSCECLLYDVLILPLQLSTCSIGKAQSERANSRIPVSWLHQCKDQ